MITQLSHDPNISVKNWGHSMIAKYSCNQHMCTKEFIYLYKLKTSVIYFWLAIFKILF